MGTCSRILANTASGTLASIVVSIKPGATALTLIFFSANAWESDRVKATIAPFVDE